MGHTAAHEYFISFQSQTLFSSNLQVTAHNGSLERFEDFQEYWVRAEEDAVNMAPKIFYIVSNKYEHPAPPISLTKPQITLHYCEDWSRTRNMCPQCYQDCVLMSVCLLSSDWSTLITWPGYWHLIGWPWLCLVVNVSCLRLIGFGSGSGRSNWWPIVCAVSHGVSPWSSPLIGQLGQQLASDWLIVAPLSPWPPALWGIRRHDGITQTL